MTNFFKSFCQGAIITAILDLAVRLKMVANFWISVSQPRPQGSFYLFDNLVKTLGMRLSVQTETFGSRFILAAQCNAVFRILFLELELIQCNVETFLCLGCVWWSVLCLWIWRHSRIVYYLLCFRLECSIRWHIESTELLPTLKFRDWWERTRSY